MLWTICHEVLRRSGHYVDAFLEPAQQAPATRELNMGVLDMMKHWTTWTFVACANIACAQTTGCQAELQLPKGADATSTYANTQVHLQGTGKSTTRKLEDCLMPKTFKPVVFDQGFIDDLCACPANGFHLSIVRVEWVRHDEPLDLVRLELIYERDN